MSKSSKRAPKRGKAAHRKGSSPRRNLDKLLKAKREQILRLAAKHGVQHIRVFGSVPRGEAILGSDVDFLVDVESPNTPFFPGGLVADLEDLLGCRVDVVTEEGLHWYIREQVIGEARPL